MWPIQVSLIIGTLLFLLLIIYFLMKHRLELRYTLIWFAFGVILLLLAIFPNIAYIISKWFGIATPVNMIFLFAFIFTLLIILSLTMIVSQQASKIKRLAQKLALLENRVHSLELSNKTESQTEKSEK